MPTASGQKSEGAATVPLNSMMTRAALFNHLAGTSAMLNSVGWRGCFLEPEKTAPASPGLRFAE
jgi:hypothetical protein